MARWTVVVVAVVSMACAAPRAGASLPAAWVANLVRSTCALQCTQVKATCQAGERAPQVRCAEDELVCLGGCPAGGLP